MRRKKEQNINLRRKNKKNQIIRPQIYWNNTRLLIWSINIYYLNSNLFLYNRYRTELIIPSIIEESRINNLLGLDFLTAISPLSKILINNLNHLTISNDFKVASNSDFIFFCLPLNIDKNLNTNFKNYYDLIKKYYLISKYLVYLNLNVDY
mgnify:CR=1 FL=1